MNKEKIKIYNNDLIVVDRDLNFTDYRVYKLVGPQSFNSSVGKFYISGEIEVYNNGAMKKIKFAKSEMMTGFLYGIYVREVEFYENGNIKKIWIDNIHLKDKEVFDHLKFVDFMTFYDTGELQSGKLKNPKRMTTVFGDFYFSVVCYDLPEIHNGEHGNFKGGVLENPVRKNTVFGDILIKEIYFLSKGIVRIKIEEDVDLFENTIKKNFKKWDWVDLFEEKSINLSKNFDRNAINYITHYI